MHYKKSQIATLLIGIMFLFSLTFGIAYVNQWGNSPLTLTSFLIVTSILALITVLFYKLTVEIDGKVLKLTYGIGLIKFKFQIDKLEKIQTIKIPWHYGLGIRLTSQGILYNIHGLKAVKIKYSNSGKSKSMMIGTAEPELLKEAFEKSFL